VLDHVAAGLTIRAIARELDLADETIREYLADAYRKLGVRTRTEAVTAHRARRAG
jgi:DNA-binding NarL/FixJ family response regulator